MLLLLIACGEDEPTDVAAPPVAECSGWQILSELYPDVTLADLRSCDGGPGEAIARSLMNLDGLDIRGETVVADDGSHVLTPCVEALCDDDHAYVASNALPHYDPQALPLFDTVERPIVHRI